MRNRITYLSFVAAVSGLLFGFDTAVISGADKPIQQLWGLSDLFHGIFIMSSALWGTVIGAMFGGKPLDTFGRKKVLIWIGIFYLASALGSGLAWDPYSFSFFRFLGGLGVGASSVAAPTYISEIAPTKQRGRLGALYQFLIVLGILVAFFSNWFVAKTIDTESAWRWMVGLEALPALVYLLLIVRVPESPRWLAVYKGDYAQAKSIVTYLDEKADADTLMDELKVQSEGHTGESIFTSRYRKPLMLAFLVSFFNQASGINFIIYYAPRIFEETGLNASNSLIATIGIGIANLIFTMIGVSLIDKLGRRSLMIIGSIGYIVSLALVSHAFYTNAFEGMQWYIFLFIGAHAVGQGAVIWVYISEIFPNQARGQGQAFGTAVHWIGASIITLIMPYVLNLFKGGPIFAFFSVMMTFQLIWAIWFMVETKNKSLEHIEKELIK
ncbi:MAG: sugar porter family MFS transporter [Saprospiraceae bacterium]|nr:sugar porter family MFS transporter [Saprospiraceae bacterium]